MGVAVNITHFDGYDSPERNFPAARRQPANCWKHSLVLPQMAARELARFQRQLTQVQQGGGRSPCITVLPCSSSFLACVRLAAWERSSWRFHRPGAWHVPRGP